MCTDPQRPWQRPPGGPSPVGRLPRRRAAAWEQGPAAAASSSPDPSPSCLGLTGLLRRGKRRVKTQQSLCGCDRKTCWNQEWCRWYNIIVGNNPFNVSDLRFSFPDYKGNVSSWVCVIFPETYLEIYGTLVGSVHGGWSASVAWWSSWTDRWVCRAVRWRTALSARHKYSRLTGFSAGSGGSGAGLGTTAADGNGNTPVRGVGREIAWR